MVGMKYQEDIAERDHLLMMKLMMIGCVTQISGLSVVVSPRGKDVVPFTFAGSPVGLDLDSSNLQEKGLMSQYKWV